MLESREASFVRALISLGNWPDSILNLEGTQSGQAE